MKFIIGIARGVASALNLLIISLGFLGIYIVAVEIVPDLLNARREARSVKPDFRVANEDYATQPWAAPMFVETQRALGKLAWHPYDYWRPAPFAGSFVNIEDNGLRRSVRPAQREKFITVAMFGGSAVWGFGARDEGTIPSFLARDLESRVGCAVNVSNYGQPGYVSSQDLAAFTFMLRQGNTPDIAVFLQGFNDGTSAFAARVPGLPQNEKNRQQEFNLTNRNNRLTSYMTLAPLVLWRTNDWLRRTLNNKVEFAPLEDKEYAGLASGTLSVIEHNTRQGRAIASEYGIVTLHALQPTLFSKSIRSDYESRAQAEEEVVKPLFLTLSTLADAWRRQPGRADLSNIFDSKKEAVFLDGVHLTEQGNRIVAHALADQLASEAARICARK